MNRPSVLHSRHDAIEHVLILHLTSPTLDGVTTRVTIREVDVQVIFQTEVSVSEGGSKGMFPHEVVWFSGARLIVQEMVQSTQSLTDP
jgi:hypothetical protein